MKENFFIPDTIPVQVGLEDVLIQLGYPRGTCVSSTMREKVRVQMTETLPLIEPKGAYLRLEGA